MYIFIKIIKDGEEDGKENIKRVKSGRKFG